jgi:peptide-methionine (S)-S-oxide reductase
MRTEKATFAAGCFWDVEVAFRAIPGVTDVVVGYTGGHRDDPRYEDVRAETTGHAEAVEVTFDPEAVGFEQLVEHFFALHDPTQINRQGLDVGTRYRSAIFAHSDEQVAVAEAVKARLGPAHRLPITTQVRLARAFWPAEADHQRYLEKRGLVVA